MSQEWMEPETPPSWLVGTTVALLAALVAAVCATGFFVTRAIDRQTEQIRHSSEFVADRIGGAPHLEELWTGRGPTYCTDMDGRPCETVEELCARTGDMYGACR